MTHCVNSATSKVRVVLSITKLGQLAAVSVGIVDDAVVCDLDYDHDSRAQVDMNVVKRGSDLVEVQGTGEEGVFNRQQLNCLMQQTLVLTRFMLPKCSAGSLMPSVCFVCLGNICRSPMAEAVFRHTVNQRGVAAEWDIDSAGTGAWHVGNAPDRRSAATCSRHGVPCEGQARQINEADFSRFNYILVMDAENSRQCTGLRAC